MLVDDARRIATAIEERINAEAVTDRTVKTTVKSERTSPERIPAGAGRPVFTRYYIHIEDGKRAATLNLGQATGLLDAIEPDWDPDRLFEAIRAREIPIEEMT